MGWECVLEAERDFTSVSCISKLGRGERSDEREEERDGLNENVRVRKSPPGIGF
jgi:hypothetical protein